MSIGLLFWVLMVISFLFWGWQRPWVAPDRGPAGMSLLVFVLLFLLGWHEFGFVIHN
jgi:hypothetical protein